MLTLYDIKCELKGLNMRQPVLVKQFMARKMNQTPKYLNKLYKQMYVEIFYVFFQSLFINITFTNCKVKLKHRKTG